MVRPYTEGRACRSLHLFSIIGDTAAEVPFGQKIFVPSSFIGATSRSCARRDDALEYLISISAKVRYFVEEHIMYNHSTIQHCWFVVREPIGWLQKLTVSQPMSY